jgi:hypothetical protein
MFMRRLSMALAGLLLLPPLARAVELSTIERTWLEAALPVLNFARAQALPLDIIVQPQPTPGQTPMGMAFVEGRCKLVLSMRGNPQAEATLAELGHSLLGPVVEAIAAHELGHCWRHVHQLWGGVPAEVKESVALTRVSLEHAELLRDMWRTRREEGFADLVGLAWTLHRHPERYAEVHAWNVRLRAEQELESGPHDTRVWVRLAADRSMFTPAASIFDQVQQLWLAGLLAGT